MTKKLFVLTLSLLLCLSTLAALPTVSAQEAEEWVVRLDNTDYDGSYIRTSLTFGNLTSDCVMYAGIYEQSGTMKQINKFMFQANSVESITIRIPATDITETDIVKIFFFDAKNGVKPICKNVSFKPLESRARLNGIITTTCKYGGMYPDEVGFMVIDTYENDDWAGAEFTNIYMTVADGVNADKYYGISADIYFNETSKNKFEITEIVPDGLSTVETLKIDNIDENTNNYTIYYYPSEESSDSVAYKLSESALFYYNYYAVPSIENIIFDSMGMIKTDCDIEMVLIENTGDTKYDIVIAKEYNYDIVSYVDADNSRFETDLGSAFKFDFEDADIQTTITNIDEEAITLSDINEGDVIAWMSDNNSTNCANYCWIEIINLADSTIITGKIDGVSSSKVTINDTSYTDITGYPLRLGDEGIFYLTLGGKIFDYKACAINAEYAYILNAAYESSFDSAGWQIRLLTSDNQITDYYLASSTTYDGYLYNTENYDQSFPLSNITGNFSDNCEQRVITYNISSDGLINEINTANLIATTSTVYDESSHTLGYGLKDNSVIFNIDSNSDDTPYAAGLDILIDGNEYDAYVIENEIGEFAGAVIESGECNYVTPEPEIPGSQNGYILSSAISDTAFTTQYKVRILSESGETSDYTVCESFLMDGTRYHTYDESPLKIISETNYLENPEIKFVNFEIDDAGCIYKLNTYDMNFANGKYYSSDKSLSGIAVNENVKIFNIGDYSYTTDINFLINNGEYEYLYNENENGEIDYLIITKYSTLIDYTQSIAIVSDVTDVLYDDKGTVAKEVEYYSSGESTTKYITIADDYDISYPVSCDYSDIVPGTFIMFTNNGKGTASAYTVLAKGETSTYSNVPAYWLNDTAIEQYVQGNDKDNGIVAGYINTWTSKNGKRIVEITPDYYYVSNGNDGTANGSGLYDIIIDSNVNTYTFITPGLSTVKITPNDWMATSSIDVSHMGTATYFIAFLNGPDAIDFITFSTRKEIASVSPVYFENEDISVNSDELGY